MTCIRDIINKEQLEREFDSIRKCFETLSDDEKPLRIEWGTKKAFEMMEKPEEEVLGYGTRKGLQKTLRITCTSCIITFPSMKKFLDHWFEKHFKEKHGGLYTYKDVVAKIKLGGL